MESDVFGYQDENGLLVLTFEQEGRGGVSFGPGTDGVPEISFLVNRGGDSMRFFVMDFASFLEQLAGLHSGVPGVRVSMEIGVEFEDEGE